MKRYIYIIVISTCMLAQELITPIPININVDEKKAELGNKLFHDKRLSKNNTISCSACHIINEGGDDNRAVSYGINGLKGTRNSPTVLNATFNTSQFWDGRSSDLREQAIGPIHNPVEMGSSFQEIIEKLKKDNFYIKRFSMIYDDGITENNIIDAIVEYENTLITPNSKFDKYLKGDKNILTKKEKEGFQLFKEYGCISCHNGVNIGGNIMQKLGVFETFETTDFGKYNITKNEEDKFYFKVPSLRNIQQTSPYFHNGLTSTLRDAVNKMAFHQVGYILDKEETDKIILFLKTLDGEMSFLEKTYE